MSFSFNVEADRDQYDATVDDAVKSYTDNTPDLTDSDKAVLDSVVTANEAAAFEKFFPNAVRYRLEVNADSNAEADSVTVRLVGLLTGAAAAGPAAQPDGVGAATGQEQPTAVAEGQPPTPVE